MADSYAFGRFRLHISSETLFWGAETLPVGRRAVALLRALIERPGVPVSKDALIAAAWPGLAVEESNLTVQIAGLRKVLSEEAGGDKWIETLPRRGYRFVGPVITSTEHGTAAVQRIGAALPLPDKPSIAVLPFQNLSSEPDQEYFADGTVEEIITALSRNRWLFVIARNSSFIYKGRMVDARQIGRELGVRYVLEGSVRKAADRVRITGQLIDASSGAHIWADRFDGALGDIFDLQDEVTARVVGAIAPKLEQAEIERAKHKPTESLSAYDYYLRGRANLRSATRSANDEALRLFYRAIELDADFASAYGMCAYCYVWRKANGWMEDRAHESEEVARLLRHAVKLGKDVAVALCFGGFALARVVGDLEGGAALLDKALNSNPNLGAAWGFSGRVKVYLGDHETAIKHLAHAMRLSPLDPEIFGVQGSTAYAHYFCGRYHEASIWADKAVQENPSFLPVTAIAAASHAMTGEQNRAQNALRQLQEIDPALRISNFKDQLYFRRDEDMNILAAGLQKAGLPE